MHAYSCILAGPVPTPSLPSSCQHRALLPIDPHSWPCVFSTCSQLSCRRAQFPVSEALWKPQSRGWSFSTLPRSGSASFTSSHGFYSFLLDTELPWFKQNPNLVPMRITEYLKVTQIVHDRNNDKKKKWFYFHHHTGERSLPESRTEYRVNTFILIPSHYPTRESSTDCKRVCGQYCALLTIFALNITFKLFVAYLKMNIK